MDSYTRGLDFETYAGISLPEVGLAKYVAHPTFTPILASVYWQDDDGEHRKRFDFTADFDVAKVELFECITGHALVAHNAPFEMAVCDWLGYKLDPQDFIDSAVIARAAGAQGKLELAGPQLLDIDKVETGKALMRVFSMPGKYQEANGSLFFDPLVVAHNAKDWEEYGHYCDIDAELGWRIHKNWGHVIKPVEWVNSEITNNMNDIGWPVDLNLVHEMQRRYQENMDFALEDFYLRYQPGVEEKDRLNFNSFPQMKKWCEVRGVKPKSFDEEHVTLYLTKIRKRLEDNRSTMPLPVAHNLTEVVDMLVTKQVLGGSSLKKLQSIIDQTSEDGRLRGQYLHVGAGQTWRTSGRGVQMQNLKRLGEVANMADLDDADIVWDNDELARNLRQVFTSSHPDGQLVVGDFSSVESRGLAYLAGAEWKLKAFREGKDMYKVLAARIDGTGYDAVTKDRRQFGKVGELSCGYQAGGSAVQKFAKKMGTILTEGEANQLVYDWRDSNPEVVQLWADLDALLWQVVDVKAGLAVAKIGNEMTVEVLTSRVPESLLKLNPKAVSIQVRLKDRYGTVLFRRYFHGCHVRGRNIGFYKPSKTLAGDPWVNYYKDPKTDEVRFYSVYGGKLAGILTQSMCREIFFRSLRLMRDRLDSQWEPTPTNVQIIGQFHDEIVLDWWPSDGENDWALDDATQALEHSMSEPGNLLRFPLEADIKHDYRYIK